MKSQLHRSFSISLSMVFCLVMLSGTAWPESGRTSKKTARAPAKAGVKAILDPSARQLATLLAAQQRALGSGNPAEVAAATRPLIAHLLQELAKLRLGLGASEEAIELDRKSILMQDLPETRLELASVLLRTNRPKEAAAETATALKSDPGNPVAWATQGSALRSMGDDKGAVQSFERSLELRQDVNVAYALASSLLSIHEKEKAERIFREIITASGNAAIWHVAAGDAYREARYLSEAAEEFKKAIAIDPRVGHAEFFLGLTYLQMNMWGPNSQSFEHLRAAVRLAPRDYVSNFYLGAIESTDGSDLASSDRHLQVAREANPNAAEVWLYLGLNASREKNTAVAKTYLRKAVELTGEDEAQNNYQIRRVYAVLGRILISEGNRAEGDALLAKYRRTESLSIANSARTIAQAELAAQVPSPSAESLPATTDMAGGMASPSPIPALKQSGRSPTSGPEPVTPQYSAEEGRQLAAAEKQFHELLAASSNDLGTALAQRGDYQQALQNFQEAERWQSPSPALLRNLGVAAFKVQNFSESTRALSLYLQAEQKTPTAQADRARLMLAMSLFSLGRFKEADRAFTAVSTLALQDPRTAYAWAYVLAHSGQQQHATEIADSLQKQSLPSDVLSLICHLYMDVDNHEQSLACFRKAYQSDPNLQLAHYQAAQSLIHLDRPAEAVNELRQEMVVSPQNPEVRYSLAYALLQSSQKKEAMSVLEELTASDPSHAQAQYQLGKALLEDGNVPKAVEHLEFAAKDDPALDYVHYQLQAAYRKVGRAQDADRELALYRELKARSRATTPPQSSPQAPQQSPKLP